MLFQIALGVLLPFGRVPTIERQILPFITGTLLLRGHFYYGDTILNSPRFIEPHAPSSRDRAATAPQREKIDNRIDHGRFVAQLK